MSSMSRQESLPTVPGMYSKPLLRLGACTAFTGAAAQLIASLLEPDWGGDADEAIRVVSDSQIWMGDRLLDLVGVFLTIAALTVVGRMLAGAGNEWVRIGAPFLILMGALGGGAVLTGAVMKDLAETWEHADGAAQGSYLAAFDAVSGTTEALFFGAFLALGAYLAFLAPAILRGGVFARWTGWTCAVSAGLVLAGNLLSIVFEPAFFAVLAGFALFLLVVAALGASMWRQASESGRAYPPSRLPVGERS
jgi:hypothetical protein